MKIKKKIFILIAAISAIFAHQCPMMASAVGTLSAQTQSNNAQNRLWDGKATFSQVGRHMQAFNHTNSSSLSNGHSQGKSDLEAQNTHNSQNLVESVAQTQAARATKKNKQEQYPCYYKGAPCITKKKKTRYIKLLWKHWQTDHLYYICPACSKEFEGTKARNARITHAFENSCIPGVAKDEIANALDDLDNESDSFYRKIGLNHTNLKKENDESKGKKRRMSKKTALSYTADQEEVALKASHTENNDNNFYRLVVPQALSDSAARALDIESGAIDPTVDLAHYCLVEANTNAATNLDYDDSGQVQIPLSLKCPNCDEIFSENDRLKKHIDTKHTGQIPHAHMALPDSGARTLDGQNSSNDFGHVRANNALSDLAATALDVESDTSHTHALSALVTRALYPENRSAAPFQDSQHCHLLSANADFSTDFAADASNTKTVPSDYQQNAFPLAQAPIDTGSTVQQAQIALRPAQASQTQNTTHQFGFSMDFLASEEHNENQNENEKECFDKAADQVLAVQLPQNSGHNSVTSPSMTEHQSSNSSSDSSNAAIPCSPLQNAQTPTPQESPSVSDLVNVPLTHNLAPQYATSTTTKKLGHLRKKGLSKGIKTSYKQASLFDTNEHSSSSNSSLPSAPLAITPQNTPHNATNNHASSAAPSELPSNKMLTIAFACPHCTKPFVKKQGLAGHLASCKNKPKKTTPSISNPTSASTAQTSNTIQTNADLTHTSMASALVVAAHKKLNSSSSSDDDASNSGSKKKAVKKAAASASSSSSATTPTSRVAAEATPPQTSSQAQKKNDDADAEADSDNSLFEQAAAQAPKTKKGTKRKNGSNNMTLAASSSHAAAATSSSSNSSSSSASTASAVAKKVIVKKTPTITASNSSTNKSRGAAELARQKINSQTRKKYNEDADTDSDDSHDENYDANNATSENDDGDGDQARKPQNKKRKVSNNSSSFDASSKSQPRLSAAAHQIAKKSAALIKQDSPATKSEKDQKQGADYICTACDTRVVDGHVDLYQHKKAQHTECPTCHDFFNDDTLKKHACTPRSQVEFRCYHKDCYQLKNPPIFKQYHRLKAHEKSHIK